MTFSDDDLKRLKDASQSEKWEGSLVALIARLEAAEHWVLDCPHDVDTPECACEKAWRKAAGKSEKENP